MSTSTLRFSTVTAVAAAAATLCGSAWANTPGTAYVVGTAHNISRNWSVAVLASDSNANAEVANANMFNDSPKAGYQYVSVLFRTQKLSSGEGNAFWDVRYRLYGRGSHRLYESADSAYLRNAIEDADSVLKGGRTTASIVFEVAKSDIRAGGMQLVVEDESTFSSSKSWFRLR